MPPTARERRPKLTRFPRRRLRLRPRFRGRSRQVPQHPRNQSGPAGLVAGSAAAAVVAVEVLVELHVLAPVGVVQELADIAVAGATTRGVGQEDSSDAGFD